VRWWWVLVLVLLGPACVVQTPFSSSVLKARERAERKAAMDLVPIDPVVPDGPVPPLHVFKMRVWVDADFRAKPRWRADVEEVTARAGSYVEAAFGARLDVEIRTWDHSGDASMPDMMNALAAADPGNGADWVVGFVTAARGLTSDFHVIGYAQILGKHFLLRDMNDAEEIRAVDKYLDELSAAERTELYSSRRKHKELSSFIHEWAHTLGHPHETQPGRLLAGSYTNKAATFSDAGARFIRASVTARAGGPGAAAATAEMKKILEENPAGWVDSERSQELAMLGAGVPMTGFASRPGGGASEEGVAEVQKAYDRQQAGDRPGALAVLDGVRGRLVPGSEAWENAARLYLGLGALARADELLAKQPNAPAATEIGRDVVRLRRQVGLSPDPAVNGVKPEDESEVVNAFIEAAEKMSNNDRAEARRIQDRLVMKFPRALPTLVLRCAVAGLSSQVSDARRLCGEALKRWNESTYALFWLAQTAPSPRERIKYHKRVIELDPGQTGSWEALADLYRQTKDRAALDALAKDYKTRFNRDLPAP